MVPEPPRPAVFLDRDGTLNREVDYLADPAGLELLPGVGEALRELADAGYRLVVVTNQSGVARGLLDEPTLLRVHDALRAALARHGVALDRIAYCPHHPEVGPPPYRRSCECRKPRPGLLADAARELDLDLERSWIVGDSERDLLAGAALGLPGVLVATGKGRRERERLAAAGRPPRHFAADLREAARIVLGSA